jgi:hypothetical protein
MTRESSRRLASMALSPDDPDALDAETLKRFARQTAEEMAGEYGINLPMVQEEES